MELIKFMFSDFWVFVGCLLVIGAVLTTIAHIFESISKCFNRK